MKKTNTPVLIIIFNRPEKVRALIEALSKVQPKYLYIAADGPRKNVPTDRARCAEAQKIATTLPWDCEVRTNFSDTNLGCDQAVPRGIDWFFEHVASGIILEDDCIPHPSFFSFCGELLERYKDNKKIMHISGNNFQDSHIRGDASYYFSLYTHSWGWATWSRAWRHFHPAIEGMTAYRKEKRIQKLPLSKNAQRFWMKHFLNRNHWDAFWQYTVWYKDGLSIIPQKNLVTNIGFDEEATHTEKEGPLSNIPVYSITNITHPAEMRAAIQADEYTFMKVFYTPIWKRIVIKLGAMLQKIANNV
ncbi:hypothetical protein COB18_03800 [Candidatus Kaiserbacteria bacterium]|nr:MAG: hypothetical protein COB18_03800 [Candidatus Kaiserbacteria bacterium]